MKTENTIKYTYDWLNTAFSELPKYNNAEDYYNKSKAITSFNYEELEEYILGISLDEKINALADIRVVSVNICFFRGYGSEEVLDMYHLVRDYKYDMLIKMHTVDIFAELLSKIRDTTQITSIETVVDILILCEAIAFKLTKDSTLQLLFIEDNATYLSNMTKFCKTEEEAFESVRLYQLGQHPNKMGIKVDTRYEETGHESFPYRILTNKDNKIMKSKEFMDVDKFKNKIKL